MNSDVRGQLPPDRNLWHFPIDVNRVVDGDTIDTTADLGFKTRRDVRVRLYGVDTREVYGVDRESEEYKRGKVHSAFTRDWLDGRDDLCMYSLKDTGKYGRYLVDIVDSDGNSLVSALYDEFGDEVAP